MSEVVQMGPWLRRKSLDAKAASALRPMDAKARSRAYELSVKYARFAYPLRVPSNQNAEVLYFGHVKQ